MKKILQIVNHMYPHIGGIEQVARDVVSALSDGDYEQRIICFNEDAAIGDAVCHRKETVVDQVDGVDTVRCGCIAKVASQSISLSYGKQLKKVMNEFQPDVVIFHFPNPFQAHYLLKYKKRSFKLFVYWHLDITRQKFLGKLFHGQTRALIKRADKIVATSPNYINESPYLSQVKEKCSLISCCIDSNRVSVSDADRARAKEIRKKYVGKFICFAFGRHVPYKGYSCLIDAAKHLDEDFVVLIGGTGPLTDELRERAKGDEKIEFLGRIIDADLRSYLLSSDVFCFSSITKNEAFGIALAEAMYYQKPAVTFTVKGSGINYVSLNGVTGIECPNGDVLAYAEALKKLAKEEDLRKVYGENARKRVEELFLFPLFKQKIRALVDEE